MIILPDSELKENIQKAEVFLIGDVRDVLYSRAERVVALPSLLHGLGVCGTDNPMTVGEGIVVRGRAAKTSPDSDAGLKVDYLTSSEGLYSPFLVGWRAKSSFTTQFISESGLSLNQLYQSVFLELQECNPLLPQEYVFLEIFGLFQPEDIFDRALQLPVSQGHVLTTSAEHAVNFFKPRIIYNDLINRSASVERLMPLCVVGMGHLRDGPPQSVAGLNERVFYAPPLTAQFASSADRTKHVSFQVVSHNHALGWQSQQWFNENLLSSVREGSQLGSEAFQGERTFADELLEWHPDYLVHLDDWTIMKAATVRIYLAQANRFKIQTIESRSIGNAPELINRDAD
jgi:hypothetical protein